MSKLLKNFVTGFINHPNKWLGSLAILICAWGYFIQPVQAEGSRDIYPSGTSGDRADLEWRTSSYGPSSPVDNSLLRRTLLKVYAQAGEYIFLGSSSMNSKNDSGGVGTADITIFKTETGRVGNETLSNIAFQCSAQRTASGNVNQGQISSRNQELAGPDTVPSGSITNGYVPCYYQAPSTGIYYVAFYGSDGKSSNFDGKATSAIDFGTNFKDPGGTSIAAWDVTVRNSLTSTTNIPGRLFADYLALYTGANGKPLYSQFYVVTRDGYRYQTNLNGIDPDAFILYGSDIGLYDNDGKTPLYHDVVSLDTGNGQLTSLDGGTNLALPNHIIFFNSTPDNFSLTALNIPLIPTPPTISNANYTGTAGANTSNQNTGGTFTFTSGTTGVYEIVISRNGTDFDPGNLQNRVLRGLMTVSGGQTVNWDGKDNIGNFFPVGKNYQVHLITHVGEYHFPLIDAENSINGGPSFTLLNATNPLGNNVGFYDDRGYRTASGVNVQTPGTVLCGLNPPSIPNSNLITGFDTTTNQRKYGANPGSNTNHPCTGSFGDVKGLDIWTYVPSTDILTSLNIVKPRALATILKTNTAYSNAGTPNNLSDDLLTYELSLRIESSDVTNNGTVGPAPLAGTSISVDGVTVTRILISDAIPTTTVNTVLNSTPTTITGWKVVYTTTPTSTSAEQASWKTTPPGSLSSVTRIGFINDPTVLTVVPIGTTVSGFSIQIKTTGATGNGPYTINNIAQVVGATNGDPSTKVYDNSGDQNPNNYDTVNNVFPTTEDLGVTSSTTDAGNNNSGTKSTTGDLNVYNISIPSTSSANLLLVKRVTRINNQTSIYGQNLAQFVDGRSDVASTAANYVATPHDTDDNNSNWPSNYLQGLISAGTVNPGDDLEYTIYFLSAGGNGVKNAKLCDLVPANSTFVPTAFNGLTPNGGGLSGADQGIALAIGSTTPTMYVSNVADTDAGRFYPAGDSSTPAYCGTNTNGAVEVTINDSTLPGNNPLPAATAPGTPTNSYGFIRFHAKVK